LAEDFSFLSIRSLIGQRVVNLSLDGNSIFEINAHLALAFDQVNRTEFSLLNTNDLIQQPIVFKNGKLQAPIEIGHGLYPIMNKLFLSSEPDTLRTAL
jgi:hypothetical protein